MSGLSAAAPGIAVAAGRRAEAAERRREIDPAIMAAVVEAGFARHFAPAAVGGSEGSFAELVDAVGVIAAECPATAWCASLIAGITRMAGAHLPADGQAEVWAGGPDAVLVGSVTPFGTAEPRPGGWSLSGRWPYLSAIGYSDWAVVCGVAQSGTATETWLFAVPRSAYRIEDTWSSIGMRATGSNTLVLTDVFVPDHRAFRRADLFEGRIDDFSAAAPACYRAPLPAVNGLMFAAPAVGAAQGMARAFTAAFADKLGGSQLPGTVGVQGVRVSAELALARAAGEADAARLLLERAAGLADRCAGPETVMSRLDAARNMRDCSLATDLAVAAVDRLFRQAGTRGQMTSGAMQRLWRDVNSVATHVALQFEPAARGYVEQLVKQGGGRPVEEGWRTTR